MKTNGAAFVLPILILAFASMLPTMESSLQEFRTSAENISANCANLNSYTVTSSEFRDNSNNAFKQIVLNLANSQTGAQKQVSAWGSHKYFNQWIAASKQKTVQFGHSSECLDDQCRSSSSYLIPKEN